MIESLNMGFADSQQSTNNISKNIVSFRGNSGNKFVRTPNQDAVQIETKKSNTVRKLLIGTILITGAAVAADFVFAKGKHIKKMLGKGEKAAENKSKTLTKDAEKKAKSGGAYTDKGMYGQDINDPLDPANRLDPTSPYYDNGLGDGFGSGFGNGGYGGGIGDGYGSYGGYGSGIGTSGYGSGIGGGYGSYGGYGSGIGTSGYGSGIGGGYGSGFGGGFGY